MLNGMKAYSLCLRLLPTAVWQRPRFDLMNTTQKTAPHLLSLLKKI